MDRVYNNLKGCYQNVVYLNLVANTQYEFKFKLRDQFLVDQNYPTIITEEGPVNNYLYVKDTLSTPGWKAKSVSNFCTNFNCRVFQWEKIRVNSDISFDKQLLEGHTMCQIGQYIYIFGGRLRDDYTSRLVKTSVHRLNTLIPEQIISNQRAFHHAVAYGNKMLVYGGHNKEILQDFAIYDTIIQEWEKPQRLTGKFPQKGQNKSMVLYDNLLILFGGYYCSSDFQYEETFNQIQVIDIKLMKWVDEDLIKVTGQKPKPRFLHSAAIIDSDMFVFGGKCLDESSLNDLWKINLETVSDLRWEQKKPKGKAPSPRHGHSCDVINKNLIIFGGKDSNLLGDIVVYDSEKNQWIYPIIKNPEYGPSPRAFHASCCINNEHIALLGGKNDHFKTTSIYVLRPKNQAPTSILDIEEQDFQSQEQSSPQPKKKKLTIGACSHVQKNQIGNANLE